MNMDGANRKRRRPPSPPRPWDDDLGTGIDHVARSLAGKALAEELIDMYLVGGRMTAKALCVLCHFASEAGVAEVAQYALKPCDSTGNYQKKLDRVLELRQFDDRLYQMTIPGTSRNDLDREPQIVHLTPPHEALKSELDEKPEIISKWSEEVNAGRWIEEYETHPVVQGASAQERERILPLALYLDKTPYTNKDGFLAIYVNFLTTGRRHMIACLRQADLCSCGCSHWCSLYPVYSFIAWSLRSLLSGVYPGGRHDGNAWKDGDKDRAANAGKAGDGENAWSACVLNVLLSVIGNH